MTSRFLLLGCALLFVPRSADAAPVRLAVASAPRCPDAARFETFVKTAEPAAEITTDESAPLADVRLEARGERFHGELRWRDGDARVAEAADCQTLARALALMVAMKSNEAPPAAPVVAVDPPAVVPAPPPRALPWPDALVVAPKRPESGVLLGAIARSQFIGSHFSPGLGIGYMTRSTTGWPFAVTTTTQLVKDGNEHFGAELVMTSLSVCPAGVRRGPVTVYACVRGEIGSKEVTTKPASDSQLSFWAAGGMAVQVRYDVTDDFFVNIEAASVYTASTPSYAFARATDNGVVLSNDTPSRWNVPVTTSVGVAW